MSTTAEVPAPPSAKEPILRVKDLSVHFYVDGEWFAAADKLNYEVRPGEVLAIVGESGSGKSQSSLALMGLLPENGRATGSARLANTELIGLRGAPLRNVRGKEIAMIFQEPMTALNPVYTIGFQIVETLRTHFNLGPKEAKARALELLKLVEMPDPGRRISAYPHQLSGGQRQRAMIAQALACEPKLLVADEPTTALDVTVQAEILNLMNDLRHRIDSAIILITHDMGVVADMASRILVMRQGKVVERGSADDIFYRPQHPYTKALLAAVPHLGAARTDATSGETPGATTALESAPTQNPAPATTSATAASPQAPPSAAAAPLTGSSTGPVMRAKGMDLVYPKRGRQPAFKAVEGFSLEIAAGEVVGLVGESGSGKTTVGRAVVGLLPVGGGSLEVAGRQMQGIRAKELRDLRRELGIVFQDPGSSLNPRLPIGESIGEPLMLHEGIKGAELSKRVEELLDQVELARAMRNRYPHELSGGQRQRVGIARALSLNPKLLVADEPTSALDVSVQAHVLDLFQTLQRERGFACLFVSHDLAVVEMLADRVAVMHLGKLVELGPTEQVIHNPQEAYTQRLVAAVPLPDPQAQRASRAERERVLAATEDLSIESPAGAEAIPLAAAGLPPQTP